MPNNTIDPEGCHCVLLPNAMENIPFDWGGARPMGAGLTNILQQTNSRSCHQA